MSDSKHREESGQDRERKPKGQGAHTERAREANPVPPREMRGYPRHPYGYVPNDYVPDDYLPAEAYGDGFECEELDYDGDWEFEAEFATVPTEDDCEGAHPAGCGHRNRELGRCGEEAAARELQARGFRILERNWTCMAGEADIIAECRRRGHREIHFIEVKTRTSTCNGFPEEAVDARKRLRYERIAEMYLRDHLQGCARITFDIMSVLAMDGNRAFMRMHFDVLGSDLRR